MIERVLLVCGLAIIGWLVWELIRRQQSQLAAKLAAQADPLLGPRPHTTPTLLYFTAPTCAPCRLQQTPILNQLQAEFGAEHLRLIRVDATEDTESAQRWGIFSVPTLFLLDPKGQPVAVHHGVVGLNTLKNELLAIQGDKHATFGY